MPSEPTQSLKGIALILLTMLTFATQDAITKTLAQDLAVAQIVMVRYWMFAVFATVLIANRPIGLRQAARARRPWLQIVRSVIFVVEVGVFAWVVGRMPLSTAQAIFAACPLIVTALSPVMLGERVGPRRWLAVTAGFIGVVIILRPTDGFLDPVGIVAVIDESPGESFLLDGRRYKMVRGMGSLSAMEEGSADRYFQEGQMDSRKLVPEGIEARVPYKGPLADTVFQLVGGLQSGMGYCGAATLEDLHERARFCRITSVGLRESHPHGVTITREAPNYRL